MGYHCFSPNIFSYYVAYAGDAGDDGRQAPSTFIIGDGIVTNDGTTTFTNPPPETGVNYYVFIRLYSAIDVSQCLMYTFMMLFSQC